MPEYDVVCEVGAAFNSAQKEAARSIEAMLAITPEISPLVLDVMFKNKKEHGMDLIAERLREQAFNNGNIPESQWTQLFLFSWPDVLQTEVRIKAKEML